jgi:hypothetical protein
MKDCIESTRVKDVNGYPLVYRRINGKQKIYKEHRLVYEQHNGTIPQGLLVRHACDNPSCINPNHLLMGTARDNSNDKVQRKRHAYGMTHPRHKLTEQDVLNIRASDRTDKELANAYNIDRSTIRKIKLKRTWKHI